jgi:hypothetical protein
MIAEIDEYEKQCERSIQSKSLNYSKGIGQYLSQIERFHEENSKNLSEFETGEKEIKDGIAEVNQYLKRLKKEDFELKKIKFNGKMLEFKKNEDTPIDSLFGSLTKKQLIFDLSLENIKKGKQNNQIFQKNHDYLHFFKLESKTNAVFFINSSHDVDLLLLITLAELFTKSGTCFQVILIIR